MQLSVLLAAWSGTPDLAEMTLDLCRQVKPMCDELVVSEDGNYSAEIESIADIYLIHPRMGHGKNLNNAFKASSGEFVAILDTDIILTSGNLRDLCQSGKVVTPVGFQSWGWFFVSPRNLIANNPPFDSPGPEGIDHWWRAFQETVRDVVVHSDKLSFIHLSNRSYTEWQQQKRIAEIEYQKIHPNKEIDPQRHKARLLEDSVYAAEWASE